MRRGRQLLGGGEVSRVAAQARARLGQHLPGHGAQVHLIRPIHQAQGAAPGPEGGQGRVGREAHGAKNLHGPVYHALLQPRSHHFDGSHLRAHLPWLGRVPLVQQPGGVQHQPARLVDLDA